MENQTALLTQEEARFARTLENDPEIRQQAHRFIGACIAKQRVEYDESPTFSPENTRAIESLYDALHLAAQGDQTARNMVSLNVETEVVEQTIKSGHVSSVALDIDATGRVLQFGQSMESVQENSLRYASNSPQILARTKAETLNAFRIADYAKDGTLEDNYVLVLSRAPDDIDEAEMGEAGFFTDTMSSSLQLSSIENGALVTESAFVAGKATPSSARHDAAAMSALCARFGLDSHTMNATELLANPIVIPKYLAPNGVVDIVQLYDEVLGAGHFFGEAKPSQDYQNYKQTCVQRQANFSPMVHMITEALIEEAAIITSRVNAVERLSALVELVMVKQSVVDESIDARVYGAAAAQQVALARSAWECGDMQAMEHHAGRAVSVAVSSNNCPTALLKAAAGEGGPNGNANESADSSSIDEDKYGSLTFYCKNGHLNRRPRGKLISQCRVSSCKNSVAC